MIKQSLKSAIGNSIPTIFWRLMINVAHRRVLRDRDIRHYLPSIAYSLENQELNSKLFTTSIETICLASKTKIKVNPDLRDAKFMNQFPGEHYKFLNALVKVWQPELVVEVGTSTGMSASCILQAFDHNGKGVLNSFDLIPYKEFQTHITDSKSSRERFRQSLGDLANEEFFFKNKSILDEADLIFIDGPKDGKFEYDFLRLLTLLKKKERLLLIDDIKFINMIDLWRSIESPKIDVTSFAHFSGTGLVLIEDKLKLRLEKTSS